jgi:hypothetical protein
VNNREVFQHLHALIAARVAASNPSAAMQLYW